MQTYTRPAEFTSDAYKRVVACRSEMIDDAPFFGHLALKLVLVEDPSCQTFWTDGTHLGFSPRFAATLSKLEIKGVLVHEVLHCALGHPWRRGARDHKRWNIAADYAINPIIVEAGFALPACALLDKAYRGKSADWIYDRLPQPQEPEPQPEPEEGEGDEGGDEGTGGTPGDEGEPEEGDGEGEGSGDQPGDGDEAGDEDGSGAGDGDEADDKDGSGKGSGKGQDAPGEATDPGGMGECRDAPPPAAPGAETGDDPTPVQTEADWAVARDMAERIAISQGNMPGGLRKLLGEAKRAKVDWRAALRNYVQQACAADYTWQRPNKRYTSHGYFLPSLHTPMCGRIVVGFDTSGSVDAVTMRQMIGEVNSIAQDVQPAGIDVRYFHTSNYLTDTFERGEEVVVNQQTESGGTDFCDVFTQIEASGDVPTVLIMLTDLYGTFPQAEPDYPVIWAVTSGATFNPWGELVPVE